MKNTLACLLIVIVSLVNAQTTEREVISSNGDYYSNSTGQLSTTLGEPIISTVNNGSNTLTQGFQQTKITVTTVEDYSAEISLDIYPNPVANSITIKVETLNENMSFTILTLEGKEMVMKNIKNLLTTFDMTQFARGSYLLSVIQNNQIIKTYRIVKQ